MNERLLQFIWQFQYFNKGELSCSNGDALQIIHPGIHNTHQGPDFSDAKIKIGDTTWAGAVELHIKTSDWDKHKHQSDPNYRNVILHVVWENDESEPSPGSKGKQVLKIPLLELNARVSKILLRQYTEWMSSPAFIPCAKRIHAAPLLTWKSWKERLLAERLTRKSKTVETYLKQNNYHWEETFWWLLARNFGATVNADAFESLARSIPMKLLAKLRSRPDQLEALLMGQSGLLSEAFTEEYPISLQIEYGFLQSKHKLRPISMPVHFLRMRPGNFPSVRLAQLSTLLNQSVHLFDKIREAGSLQEVKNRFDVTASPYWDSHYRFEELSRIKKKRLGESMTDNIIINSVAPILFAYGDYHNESAAKLKALDWLEGTSAEMNTITKGFEKLGIINRTAYDSQAVIELKNEYCSRKRCLECAIGNALLKQ